MRWKIIAVNSVVVLLVGLLSLVLVRASLADALSNQGRLREDAERALGASNAVLELDALRVERWLGERANDKAAREPFRAGLANARSEAATDFANRTRDAALASPAMKRLAPALIALVDERGVTLGRDGSTLMRGVDVGASHPSVKTALAKAASLSDVWADASSAELMLVSYAPVRDDSGNTLGLLIMGSPLNDGRLQRTSDASSGRNLMLGVASGDTLDIKAKSGQIAPALLAAVTSSPLKDAALKTVSSGQAQFLAGGPPEYLIVAAPLGGYGEAKHAVLLAASPASLLDNVGGVLTPILLVTALGLALVVVGGVFLDNYIARPIEEIEEGLLAIINGRTDLRFELEHAELGGLVFRLNSLLNQLMGVQEDDTDEEGRPSRPPTPTDYDANS